MAILLAPFVRRTAVEGGHSAPPGNHIVKGLGFRIYPTIYSIFGNPRWWKA